MEMRQLRSRAGEILSERGNRLLLIEALAVSLVFFALYSSLAYACAAVTLIAPESMELTFGVTVAHALLTVLLTFLFAAPTLLGLFRIAGKMAVGEEAVLADLFFAFSSRQAYARAIATVRGILLRGAVVWFVCELTYLAFAYTVAPTLPNAILCGILIGMEVLGGLALLLLRYPLIFASLRFEELPLPEAYVRAKEQTRFPLARGWRFVFGFLPHLLVGVLTLGILWIADTLPRMLIAYFVDCEEG